VAVVHYTSESKMFQIPLFRKRPRAPMPSHPPAPLPVLAYPLEPAPRTAVLGLATRSEPNIFSFPAWTVKQLRDCRPQALAGSYEDLETVASLRDQGFLPLPELSFPLVVFINTGALRLSAEQHHGLWRKYCLPVFEQIRDQQGRLIAWECEARQGFHFDAGITVGHRGLHHDVTPCGCGRHDARIQLCESGPQSLAAEPAAGLSI